MERGLGYHCVDDNSGSRDACGNDPRSGSIRTAFAFSLRKRPVIEKRLGSFSRDDTEREAILKGAFLEAGCGDHLSERPVKHVRQPNLICVLPGNSEGTIFVGAYFDHANEGEGVADNWSGASLLPSL